MSRKRRIHIGISGWRYAGWRGSFYPEDLRQKDELSYAAGQFRTIEINGTFYSLQRPESFLSWREETPDGFVFAVKGSRYITHMKRLKDFEAPLANFFAQGLLRLGRKLGPCLWQFPPNFAFDPDRMEPFLAALPRNTQAAAALAERHDERMQGRAWCGTDKKRPLRHAVEIRHESFIDPAFIRLLRRHHIGLVVADSVDWPCLMDVTAELVYCRLHGSAELYASRYTDVAIDRWAERALHWSTGGHVEGRHALDRPPRKRSARDVYIYFDNDAKVHAPFDARRLMEAVGAGT